MRLIYFSLDGERHFGMITHHGFLDLDVACRDYFATNPTRGADPTRFRDMKSFLAGGADSVALAKAIGEYIERRRNSGWTPRAATGARYFFSDKEKVAYLPPVLPGAKVLCMATNSLSHAKEEGREPPLRPFAFGRFTNTLVGHEGPIFLMAPEEAPDVELELGVIIGTAGRKIQVEKALEHVAGFTVVHDLGYRGLQYLDAHSRPDWVMGQGLDYSLAVGPGLVAKDEISDPGGLKMELKVNGVPRQAGTTSDYLFSVAQVLHHLSLGITLEPGDLLCMGTLGGIPGFEFGRTERILKPGDVVEGTIEGIGTLKNTIALEPPDGAPLRGA